MTGASQFPVLILAGGHSRRMGRDKASLLFAGTPLLSRVVRRLAPIAATVWVAARPGQGLPAGEYRRIDDDRPGEGPLAGLARGLAAIGAEQPIGSVRVAVAACDYPYLEPSLFPALLEAGRDAPVILPSLDGRAHPLLALWRSDVAPACEAALARGARRVRAVLDEVGALEVDAVGLLGEAAAEVLQNVNDPETLERVLRQLPGAIAGSAPPPTA